MDQRARERLPGLQSGEWKGLDAVAQLKHFVLVGKYWSFYPRGFDGEDTLLGLEITPDGAELVYHSWGDFERVDLELEIRIERDVNFEPRSFKELMDLHERVRRG